MYDSIKQDRLLSLFPFEQLCVGNEFEWMNGFAKQTK